MCETVWACPGCTCLLTGGRVDAPHRDACRLRIAEVLAVTDWKHIEGGASKWQVENITKIVGSEGQDQQKKSADFVGHLTDRSKEFRTRRAQQKSGQVVQHRVYQAQCSAVQFGGSTWDSRNRS